MPTALIRYRVRADALQRHLELLHSAFRSLEEAGLKNHRWVSHRVQDDDLLFIDYVSGSAPPNALAGIEGFARFRSGLEDRCEGAVEMTFLDEVDSFGNR